jgi:hypothetical protein
MSDKSQISVVWIQLLHVHIVQTFCSFGRKELSSCYKIDLKDQLERDKTQVAVLKTLFFMAKLMYQQCSSFIQNAKICVIYRKKNRSLIISWANVSKWLPPSQKLLVDLRSGIV